MKAGTPATTAAPAADIQPDSPRGGLLRAGASRRSVMATLCAMQLMIILDGTIVTVALPTIQQDLGLSQAGLSWVVNAYLVAFAGLLLLAGRLGDLLGSVRIFQAGLTVFTGASLLCGLAQTPAVLLTGRFIQGIGGALASAVILGMIVRLYQGAGEQAQAIGTFSFVSAAGASIGLLAGGVLTETVGWQANFLVNVPFGVLAFYFSTRLLQHEIGVGLDRTADLLGGLLITASLSLGVLAIVRTGVIGWGSSQTLVVGGVALAGFVAFLWRQATTRNPLLPLFILRNRRVSAANVTVMLVYATGFGFQFLTALYLQKVLGYSSLQTGLAFLPTAILIGSISLLFCARMIERFGERAVLIGGLALLAGAMLLLSRAPTDGHYWPDVLPVLILVGLGMGLVFPAVTMLAMSDVRPEDLGLASGLVNTTQQAGAAIGLSILASISVARSTALSSDGATTISALRGGFSLAFVVATGFVIAAIAVTTIFIPARSSLGPRST